MFGLGTIINTAAIVAGGLIGSFFGNLLTEEQQQSIETACGISVLFIGTAGAMEGMLSVKEGMISSGQAMFVTVCLVLGALLGEMLRIEDSFESLGQWIRKKSGNANDALFVNGFLTASLTVCIGAMAIVGAVEDGLTGDFTILATKSVLDFIIVMVMTCSLGKGCIFSAVPVFVLEGLITLLASLLKPVMTDRALANMSMIGSILIFCVGINLVFGKKVRVANMLPAVVFAAVAAFLG